MNYAAGAAVVVVIASGVAWQLGYQSGFAAAKRIAADAGLIPALPSGATSLSGSITDIRGTTLVVRPAVVDPYASGSASVLAVTTGTETTYWRVVPKSEVAFEAEVNAFKSRLVATGTDPNSFPVPYGKQRIQLSDVRIGDTVTIAAAAPVVGATSFAAVSVTVMNPPAAQAFVPRASPLSTSTNATTSRQ